MIERARMDIKYYTKEQLTEMCNSIISYSKIPFKYRDELDIEFEYLLINSPKDELYREFAKTITSWYFYLSIHVKLENYELCSLIKKTVDVEKKEFLNLLKRYCIEYDKKQDNEFVQITEEEVKKFYNI